MNRILVVLAAALVVPACAADVSTGSISEGDLPYDEDEVAATTQALGPITTFGMTCDEYCVDYALGASYGALVQQPDDHNVAFFDQGSGDWGVYDEGFGIGDVEAASGDDEYFLADPSTKRIRKHMPGSPAQSIVAWQGELRGFKVDAQNIYWVDQRGLYKATRQGTGVTRLVTQDKATQLLAIDGIYALVHLYDPRFNAHYIRRVNTQTKANGNIRIGGTQPVSFAHNATTYYWLEYEDGKSTIYEIAKVNSGGVHVFRRQSAWIFHIAASSTHVYWSEMPAAGGDMSIRKRPLDRGVITTEHSGAAFLGGLQLRGTQLYWMSSQDIGDPFVLETATL